jgi:hypothetical protein
MYLSGASAGVDFTGEGDMGPDIVVRSPNGQTLLAVEVKSRADAPVQWAAQLRRNLVVNGVLPSSPYFLLALPDKFFLWKQRPGAEVIAPDYEADAEEVLKPYVISLQRPLKKLSEQSFEALIRLWLDDVVQSQSRDPSPWLIASGLYQELRNGIVSPSLAA